MFRSTKVGKKFFNFPYADLQSTDNYNFQGDDTLVQPQEGTSREGGE